MSSRRPANQSTTTDATAQRLRQELLELKNQSAFVEAAGDAAEASLTAQMDATSSFDQLTGTEQAAGSLGVHPEAWKPIKFMNNAHYEQLLTSNSLDDNLARRIEAFRHVAAAQPSA